MVTAMLTELPQAPSRFFGLASVLRGGSDHAEYNDYGHTKNDRVFAGRDYARIGLGGRELLAQTVNCFRTPGVDCNLTSNSNHLNVLLDPIFLGGQQ